MTHKPNPDIPECKHGIPTFQSCDKCGRYMAGPEWWVKEKSDRPREWEKEFWNRFNNFGFISWTSSDEKPGSKLVAFIRSIEDQAKAEERARCIKVIERRIPPEKT